MNKSKELKRLKQEAKLSPKQSDSWDSAIAVAYENGYASGSNLPNEAIRPSTDEQYKKFLVRQHREQEELLSREL